MMWCFLLIGMLTLGGYCLCCGCSYCTDGTETATMQIDVGGIAADQDTATCCTALNASYILTIDPTNPCQFSITEVDGPCATTDCSACVCGVPAAASCDSNDVICDPNNAGSYCNESGTVTRDASCDVCESTEGGTVTFPAGSQSSVCTCPCQDSGLVWGTDVDPTGYDFAVVGEPVYKCTCTPKPCSGNQSSSSISLTATISTSSPGVRLTVTASATGSIFGATTTVDAMADSVECATAINALDMTADLGSTPCGSTFCLCTAPTSLAATYIP